MKSTFNPGNRRFVEHTPASQGQAQRQSPATESKTRKLIREQREAAEAKRKGRKV